MCMDTQIMLHHLAVRPSDPFANCFLASESPFQTRPICASILITQRSTFSTPINSSPSVAAPFASRSFKNRYPVWSRSSRTHAHAASVSVKPSSSIRNLHNH